MHRFTRAATALASSTKSTFFSIPQSRRLHSRKGTRERGHRAAVIRNVFTGIVEGVATVKSMERAKGLTRYEIQFPFDVSERVEIGSSVAINGTCLTATSVHGDMLAFDAMGETLSVTNLADLDVGSTVNFERSARFGDEIGGHNVSGHVHTIAAISAIEETENNVKMTFRVGEPWMKYIFSKGYVAVDGCSLTSCEATDEQFSVFLCPETLRITTLGQWKVGDRINIEIESQTQVIVDTVERILAKYLDHGQNKFQTPT